MAIEVVTLHLLLGQLGCLGVEELHQAPVLDDPVLHGNLTIGRILDGGEDASEGCHVSVLRREIVNIQAFAVKRGVVYMTARQPVNLKEENLRIWIFEKIECQRF